MNILLGDDHSLFREALHVILDMEFLNSSITHVESWTEVLATTNHKQYDLILLDLFMPNVGVGNWESCLKEVIEKQNGSVCIISASENRAHIKQAYEIGVNGYICKKDTLRKVQEVLKVLKSGKNYLAEQLLSGFEGCSKASGGATKITRRQKEVLELLAEGGSNKLIGRQLGLTEGAVKRHVYNIYHLLDAKNHTDVVRIAKQQGLLNH